MTKIVPTITCIVTCKGRLHHLKQSLPSIAGRDGVEVVVVDFDCPDRAGDWVEGHHPSVRVVRVRDAPRFNIAQARNIGAKAAAAPWFVFLDADVIAGDTFFDEIRPLLCSGCFLMAAPGVDALWGACVVERDAFERVGGYDEIIDSWGCEDVDLYRALAMVGSRRVTFPNNLLICIEHGDAERLRFQDAPSLERSWRIGHLYTVLKFDAMLLSGKRVDEIQRRRLRQIAKSAVEQAAKAGQSRLEVALPPSLFPGKRNRERRPPRLVRRIVYEIADYGELPDEG